VSVPTQTEVTGDVTREGSAHIKRFLGAQEDLRRAHSAVSSAECEVSNAEAALAKWLMPPDMKPDEKIGVWVGDSLFQVELVECLAHPVDGGEPRVSYKPKVTIRSRGKELWRLK
jgi:hypothetical protein